MNSKRNSVINEVNWNILITLGKEIKRDSMISENENREASQYIWGLGIMCNRKNIKTKRHHYNIKKFFGKIFKV